MPSHVGYLYPVVQNIDPSLRPGWMATPIVDNRLSKAYASGVLPKVGAKVDTQPVTENPKAFSGALQPKFTDIFYNHIQIEPGAIDLGNLVTDQYRIVTVFNGYFESKSLQAISLTNGAGIVVNGAALPLILGPLETVSYQVTISTEGPSTISASMLFDFLGTIDDKVIALSGNRIVMLPYQARIEWSETLQWMTNLLVSNDGTEQRIKLRKMPRQSFQGTYPIDYSEAERAYNTIYGWLTRKWAVGVWSEPQVIGTVLSGANIINCDTTKSDIRMGGLVCVWEAADKNEVFEVSGMASGSITFNRNVINSYTSAILIPVRQGKVRGSINRRTNGHNALIGISYDVTDNIDLNPATPQQYLGYDIYFDEFYGDSGGLVADQNNARVDNVDYGYGVLEFYGPWRYNHIRRSVQYVKEGPAETWAFRNWLHRRSGRLRPYWLPTFESNMRLKMSGLVSSSIIVVDSDYRTLGKDHTHLAVELDDGSWVPCAITGSSVGNGGTINIGLDTNLNTSADKIRRISFLALYRLDTDKVDLKWIGNGVMTCSLNIVEIKP